jgi:hypothetical protein
VRAVDGDRAFEAFEDGAEGAGEIGGEEVGFREWRKGAGEAGAVELVAGSAVLGVEGLAAVEAGGGDFGGGGRWRR